jgi:hypothetical protein
MKAIGQFLMGFVWGALLMNLVLSMNEPLRNELPRWQRVRTISTPAPEPRVLLRFRFQGQGVQRG